jgi:isopentenyldiphosphate isomerase
MLSLDILTVKGHYKRGEYVSAHLHLSAAYVLIAEEDEELTVKPDENSDVAWIAVEEMNKMSNEPEMIPVYQKLYERALEIKNKQKSH